MLEKLDHLQNIQSSPGEGEQSRIWYFWTTEFYPPSYVLNLLAAFEKLGWTTSANGRVRHDPALWLQDVRSQSYGGGWMNLPLLVKEGSGNSFLGAKENPLFLGVDSVAPQLFGLTSSLAAIVFRFELSKEYSVKFDTIMSSERKTEFTYKGNTEETHLPLMQKDREVDDFRELMRSNIFFWVKKNLPGVFCSSDSNRHLPTCEFVLLSKDAYASEDKTKEATSKPFNSYFHVLHYDKIFSSWKSGNIKTLIFSEIVSKDYRQRHAAFSVQEAALKLLDMKMYGGNNERSYKTYFDGSLENMLCFWSCGYLLEHFQERVNHLRDESFHKDIKPDPRKLLDRLDVITTTGVDISSVAPDVAKFQNSWSFFHQRLSFARRPSGTTQTLDFWETTSEGLKYGATQLLKSDKMLREFLIQQSDLMSASENIVVQRQMRNLTRAVIMLALVSFVVSALTLYFQIRPIESGAIPSWPSSSHPSK